MREAESGLAPKSKNQGYTPKSIKDSRGFDHGYKFMAVGKSLFLAPFIPYDSICFTRTAV